MNAATRVMTQESALIRVEQFSLRLPQLKIMVMLFLIAISLFSLVYVRDLNRRLFIDNQQLQIRSQQLQTNSTELLLEKGAWSTAARIQQIAEQQLDMQTPSSKDVVRVSV